MPRTATKSRIAKLRLNASELPKIDEEFEEITEGEELTRKEWAQHLAPVLT